MLQVLQFFLKIFKFGITGSLGLFIDFTITVFLNEVICINPYISSSIGFTISACIVFQLHRNWTFLNHDTALNNQLIYFVVLALVGCILNIGFTFLLSHLLEIDFYICKVVAALLVAIFNYWLSSKYIFKSK